LGFTSVLLERQCSSTDAGLPAKFRVVVAHLRQANIAILRRIGGTAGKGAEFYYEVFPK
jgi:hypothetical protein